MTWIKKAFDLKAHFRSVKNFFFIMDGGKEVVQKGRLMFTAVIFVTVGAVTTIYFGGKADSSFFKKSDHALSDHGENGSRPAVPHSSAPGVVGKMLNESEARNQGERPSVPHGRAMKINYKAQQVLVSDGAFDPARTMPMGTNLIGKTLTTIDTRDSHQLLKVLLPYGGRANTGGDLPKNTILFGQITYEGKGEKVFIKFTKGVLPAGQEIQVEAQGLSPGDYSPGLIGRFHGNADMRIASTLGLTMVAGVTDVLTEKESMGGAALMPGTLTTKPNMRNAMYHGVSQVAQSEANREAEAISQEQEYVTVDAGSDLIVSLTKAYVDK